MLQQQGLCGDRTDATWTEQLREGDEEVDDEDDEFAHGSNGTITANAFKTAPHRRIPSYYEFATHRHPALRFEWKFSVAAIIARLHDVVLVIGMFAIFRWEFLPALAAVLAVLGYSVNESVIVFDRVREYFRTMRKATAIAH